MHQQATRDSNGHGGAYLRTSITMTWTLRIVTLIYWSKSVMPKAFHVLYLNSSIGTATSI